MGGRAAFPEEVRGREAALRLCFPGSFPAFSAIALSSLLPGQQLSWLAPSALRAGRSTLFSRGICLNSPWGCCWELTGSLCDVFPTHLIAELALLTFPGGTQHFKIKHLKPSASLPSSQRHAGQLQRAPATLSARKETSEGRKRRGHTNGQEGGGRNCRVSGTPSHPLVIKRPAHTWGQVTENAKDTSTPLAPDRKGPQDVGKCIGHRQREITS